METIDISLDNLEPVSIGNMATPSVNFGSGIELLMNDKKRTSSGDNMRLDLGDLDSLQELRDQINQQRDIEEDIHRSGDTLFT